MYELAVWILMFHMTFCPSHNRGKVVQLVYKLRQSRKFTYNYLYTISNHSYLINYLKKLPGCVRTSRLDQNVPHDFFSMPLLWVSCIASVQATAEPQIYL